jgi:superfamily II DNA or RNA helicase
MIDYTEKKIRSILGPVIWGRAMHYYRNRNVRDVEINGQWLTASVEGSGSQSYDTSLNIENGEWECSCPYNYDGPCKHVGALMLKYHYEGIDDAGTSAPELPEPEESIETVRPLAFVKSHNLFRSAAPSSVKRSMQRYRLVFAVAIASAGKTLSPVVVPMAQFLKKDGTFGRFEKYGSEKVTEPVSKSAKELLLLISGYAQSEAPLSRVIDYTAQCRDVELYDLTGRDPVPVVFKKFSYLSVTFRCSGVDLYRMLLFVPVFICGSKKSEKIPVERISADDGVVLCRDASGSMLYNSANTAMFYIVKKLLEAKAGIYDGDIRDLSALVSSDPSCSMAVSFPHTQVLMIKGGGKPVLELEKRGPFLFLELFFDYRGTEISSFRKEDYINIVTAGKDGSVLNLAERDIDYEQSMLRYIRHTVEKRWKVGAADDEGVFIVYCYLEDFLADFGRLFLDAGVALRMKTTRRMVNSSSGKIAFRIKNRIDWFDAEAVYLDDEGRESRLEIDFELMKSGMVKIGSEYLFLKKEDLDKLSSLGKKTLAEKGTFKIHSLDFAAMESLGSVIEGDAAADIERLRETYHKLRDVKHIEKAVPPKNFHGELRHYQTEGYNWLQFLRQYNLNGCLADDMGLGKTVQTLALLQKLKEEKKLRPALLIVPVSTIPNWEQEIAHFAPGISSLRHIGQFRRSDEKEILSHDVIITSYHTLRNDIDVLGKIDFTYLILDEAQNIKNAATKAFKAVKAVKSRHRLALSGTPVENNTGELWALFDILNPGLLGTREQFSARYAKPIEQYSDKDAAARLRALVFPFILRRKKEMVAKDLPPKEEIIIYCEMGAKQKKVYDAFKRECREKVEGVIAAKGKDRASIEIFEALLKLRQIALFPVLASPQFKNVESCKFDLFTDMLSDIVSEGHKVLVFSQFVKSLSYMEAHLKDRSFDYAYIDGSTKKRDEQIQKFQNSPDVKVFLLSLKAGGVGINLTAADYVILFDPWWNPAVETQAIDRAHRIGQTRKVTAYKLIVKNTVEEKILKLQEKKRVLVSDLIAEETSFFKSLSGSDIVDLFD